MTDIASDDEVGNLASGELNAVEKIVGAGDPVPVGSFTFWFDDRRWEWSDELARLHGYEPGLVEPTTELLLSHKHPDDRDRVEAELVTSVRDHAPFSSQHRIVDAAGVEHQVVVVSEPITEDDGTVIATSGFYLDLTDTLPDLESDRIGEALTDIVAQRAVIEQAKGMLMAIYGLSADQAFGVLRWRSQETNTKLRDLCAALLTQAKPLTPMDVRARTAFDHLLLTVHRHLPSQ